LIARYIIQHIPSVVAAPVAAPAALEAWNCVSWQSGNVKRPTVGISFPWQMLSMYSRCTFQTGLIIHVRNAHTDRFWKCWNADCWLL